MHGELIPIFLFVCLIPLAAIIMSGLQKVARLRIEEARLKQSSAGTAEVEDLRQEVQQLREELTEVHERLDFTERLLARSDRPGLPEPKS